jgi:hypothetical protein
MTTSFKGIHELSVHRKLMLAILVSSTVTMVFAGLAMFLFLTSGLRRNFERDAQVLARVVAANSAGTVQFGDREAALEILGALQLEDRVVGAAITLPQGQRFVAVGEVDERWLVMLDEPQTRWASRDQLALLSPVKLDGEQVATFVLIPLQLSGGVCLGAGRGRVTRSCVDGPGAADDLSPHPGASPHGEPGGADTKFRAADAADDGRGNRAVDGCLQRHAAAA